MTATIHRGLSFASYEALPGWRWSHIKLMAESPRAVRWALDHPDDDTADRVYLRAVHCLTLEPHNFERQFSVYAGRRTGPLYDAHCIIHDGLPDLKPHEAESARATAAAIRANSDAARLLADGDPEVSITWTDGPTGLPCKARLDWLGPLGVVDIKTLGTVDERKVASMTARLGYHGQLAHYTAGLAALGIDVPAYIIAAEGKGAQDVGVFALDRGIPDGALHVGAELRRGLMERLAECVATDCWPGRHERVVDLCLPGWALLNPDDDLTFAEEA